MMQYKVIYMPVTLGKRQALLPDDAPTRIRHGREERAACSPRNPARNLKIPLALCIGEYILYLSCIHGRLAGDVRRASREGHGLDIIISNSSGKPIYEQITDQIKAAIVTGQLTEGEQLPSIRALANSLRVSAITTKRAYADLEATGLIETVQGKGSFVAGGNAELIREEQLREVEGLLARAVERGRACGLTDDELTEMLALVLE